MANALVCHHYLISLSPHLTNFYDRLLGLIDALG